MVFERFFGGDSESELVLGTHLSPLRLFTPLAERELTKDDATEVIASVNAGTHEILVTRMGGVFVRPPEELSDPGVDTIEKLQFEEAIADSINQLLCEMATRGFVSEPTSPMHIGRGELIEGHAIIAAGGGHPLRARYIERTLVPTLLLHSDQWHGHFFLADRASLDESASLARATALRGIADSLPAFVAAAYSLWSRRQVAEALIDAWIVCEQILDDLWRRHQLAAAVDTSHRDRLNDSRSFTANVRAEILYATGVLTRETYLDIQKARKRRNDLAHRSSIDVPSADEGMVAMQRLLDLVLGEEVAEPMLDDFLSW